MAIKRNFTYFYFALPSTLVALSIHNVLLLSWLCLFIMYSYFNDSLFTMKVCVTTPSEILKDALHKSTALSFCIHQLQAASR